jgi:hypothetical protein
VDAAGEAARHASSEVRQGPRPAVYRHVHGSGQAGVQAVHAGPQQQPQPAGENAMSIFVKPQPWAAGALCAQTDPELWHSERSPGSTREAKRICLGLPRSCRLPGLRAGQSRAARNLGRSVNSGAAATHPGPRREQVRQRPRPRRGRRGRRRELPPVQAGFAAPIRPEPPGRAAREGPGALPTATETGKRMSTSFTITLRTAG